MRRSWLAVLMALVLLMGMALPVLATDGFTDVPVSHWAHEDIRYVVDLGLFIGTSQEAFNPDLIMNRAMLAQVLYRYAGEPVVAENAKAIDVATGAWYAKAVSWAANQSIFASWVGTGGRIYPEEQLARSEFTVMLRNFARYLGKETVSGTESFHSTFADMTVERAGSHLEHWEEISAAMLQWAYPAGILQGTTSTTMSPFLRISRAEVATMLYRFDRHVMKGELVALPPTVRAAESTAGSPTPTAITTPTPIPIPQGYEKNAFAEEVVRLTNIERVNAGLKPLTRDDSLMQAAQIRAEEVSVLFDHVRPDGRSYSTVFSDAGISARMRGENIAKGHGSPEAVVAAWMNSQGHRANILRADYTAIGVGYTAQKGWAQLFIG